MPENYEPLGKHLRPVDTRNADMVTDRLLGINIDKYFMPSVANIIGTDLSKYKLISKGKFACNPMHVGRDERLPVALYIEDEPAIVSPAYFIFEVIDESVLLPEYLMMWFRRAEFDRICWLKTDGSVRGGISWEDIMRLELPVPSPDKQKAFIKAYQTITDRITLKRAINDNLEAQCRTHYATMIGAYSTENKSLPSGWRISNIGEYADLKSGYAFKSEWWQNVGCKVIKIANISNCSIDLHNCDCISQQNAIKACNFSVVSGDLLIAMTGATTGKIGIVPLTTENAFVNQRVGKFFLGKKPIERVPFLFATLLSERVSRQIQPQGEYGSAQDNLSPDNIKNIAIVMPDVTTLTDFNKHFSVFFKEMITNASEISQLISIASVLLGSISRL